MKANLELIRDGFMVQRYHTVGYVINRETVGHHTANVIALLFFLFDEAPPLELVRAALHHDVPEKMTGDVPATAKWLSEELSSALAGLERKVVEDNALMPYSHIPPHLLPFLKFADYIDLVFKSIDEMAAGNHHFAEILGNGLMAIRKLLDGPLADHKNAQMLYAMVLNNHHIFIQEVLNETQAPQGKTH